MFCKKIIQFRYFRITTRNFWRVVNLNKNNFYCADSKNFEKIQGHPISYWVTDNLLSIFEKEKSLSDIASPKQGLATTDNERFLRFWYEPIFSNIGFNKDRKEAEISHIKWFPINKGGEFRRWYGNNDFIVNYQDDGKEIKASVLSKYTYLKTPDFVVKNQTFYFGENGTWSAISTGDLSVRYSPKGFVISNAGMAIYSKLDLIYLIGFLNSKVVSQSLIKVINQTINFNAGDIEKLPIIIEKKQKEVVETLVNNNICISKADWDSFETSWDFVRHPLMPDVPEQDVINVRSQNPRPKVDSEYKGHNIKIADMFDIWSKECDERFAKLKANEEELNRIFIEIYGLQDELTPEVDEKDVTIRKADLVRDIKSFISYAVGCMLGRYSISVDGLVYAGGDSFVNDVYKPFDADKDNVLPVTDKAYFDDDIVGRFSKFVETVYGKETLDENLQFIADAIGGNGKEPLGVIRNYFLNDFYKDHCKMYQNKPIYWLFDAGKKNSFKALIYMHRYEETTIANLRTEYVYNDPQFLEGRQPKRLCRFRLANVQCLLINFKFL